MAATIIQFPQTHSNAYFNLKGILEIATSNEAIAEYAEIAQAIDEKGGFRPGETEEIAEIKVKIQIFEVYKSVNNKDWYRVGGTPFPQLALEVKRNLEKHGIYAKIVSKMEKPS